MKTARCAGGCVALLAGALAAAPAPSAPVVVETPHQGALAITLEAYGTAMAAPEGAVSLSLQTEGQVLRVAVAAGEAVHRGQLILELARAPAAASAYAQAQTALDLAHQQRERIARLLAQQLATGDQLAQADAALADAQATLAALDRQGAGRDRQRLVAPFDGIVSVLGVAQGDRVQAGTALATIAHAGLLVVTVGVEPSRRSSVKVGQSVRLATLDGEAVAGPAQVTRISGALDPRTRLIDVQVTAHGALLLGASYRAIIQTREVHGWLVPRDAVLADAQGEYLYQVAAGHARRVEVHRLGGGTDTSAVDGAIDPGQPLVILGNYPLHDGMAVRVQEAPAAAGQDPPPK